MKKLIILRGNSGSGKTTIAKELQNRFGRNTMLISQDVIRRDMLNLHVNKRAGGTAIGQTTNRTKHNKRDVIEFNKKGVYL